MKKVAVIQDLSSFGRCSLTAAIPVLSVMGVQPCPLPTAVLTAQSEYPSYYCEDLTAHMPHYIKEWQRINAQFDGIYTGYVTGEEQIQHIFHFLQTFQRDDTVLLVDPVMGDNGEHYPMLTERRLQHMKELTKRATIITPNITESCFLTGTSYDKLQRYNDDASYMDAIIHMAQQLADSTEAQVVITGVLTPQARTIQNVYVSNDATSYTPKRYNDKSYSGTGDLFASVIMASMLQNYTMPQAIALAEQFIEAAINGTDDSPTIAGVQFEKQLHMLLPR